MTDTLIDRNPNILGGTPVFEGTRVPVRILMEHLEAGDRLDDFLDDYPTVSRQQAVALLERATLMLVNDGDEAAVDESVPRRLAGSFPEVFTVRKIHRWIPEMCPIPA